MKFLTVGDKYSSFYLSLVLKYPVLAAKEAAVPVKLQDMNERQARFCAKGD